MECCGGLESIFCFLSDDRPQSRAPTSPNNVKVSKKATTDRTEKEYRESPMRNLWCRRRRVSPEKRITEVIASERCVFPKLSSFRWGKRSKSNFSWNTKNNVKDNNDDEAHCELLNSKTNCNEDDQIINIKVLAECFPTSTPNEQFRFTAGRTQGRSMQRMQSYMKWREQHNLDGHKFVSSQSRINDDEECWNFVVSYAAEQMKPKVKLKSKLPRIARIGPKSRNGKRVVQIIAAMIDPELASQEFYSHCVAAYLDFKLDRDSLETIIVLVDVRAGTGWTNPPAMSLLPFIKTTAKTLSTTMPERLNTCIVYPLPSPAKVIWLIIRGFLDSKHVQKIRILWGPSASPESPAPVEKMKEFFDMNAIETIEKNRLDEFRTDTKEVY